MTFTFLRLALLNWSSGPRELELSDLLVGLFELDDVIVILFHNFMLLTSLASLDREKNEDSNIRNYRMCPAATQD